MIRFSRRDRDSGREIMIQKDRLNTTLVTAAHHWVILDTTLGHQNCRVKEAINHTLLISSIDTIREALAAAESVRSAWGEYERASNEYIRLLQDDNTRLYEDRAASRELARGRRPTKRQPKRKTGK